MESLKSYNELHGHFNDHVRSSAAVTVPLLLDLISAKSVLDVGCGSGIWLSVFRQHGITSLHGLDGDYIDRNSLEIPASSFQCADLNLPFEVVPADLAICIEVGEHLGADAAERLIGSLTQAAPAVFFSAAIPGQGGMGHINEQWPSHWKTKFEARGFIAFDTLRRRIWNDDRVLYWYAQNGLLYVRSDALARYPKLLAEPREFIVDVIHPRRYLTLDRTARAGESPSLSFLMKSFPGAAKRFVKSRLGIPLNLREPSHG